MPLLYAVIPHLIESGGRSQTSRMPYVASGMQSSYVARLELTCTVRCTSQGARDTVSELVKLHHARLKSSGASAPGHAEGAAEVPICLGTEVLSSPQGA